MVRGKKGQGTAAGGAAVLLAIIAGLLIGFIIVLPPADRAELLDDDSFDTSGDDDELDDAVIEENVLTVSPGRIDFLAQDEIEHPLPVINVYTLTEDQILAELNVVTAKRGVFSDGRGTLQFQLPDVGTTDNVLLSFSVMSSEGQLIITLNGQEIHHAEVEAGNLQPISLPVNLLQAQNILEFSVSSPGIAFWKTNVIFLEDVIVIGEVTNVEAQSAKSIFLVSETEWNNLEKVTLQFQPDCKYYEVGKLQITINGNEIYNAVPDCAIAMVPIEFSPQVVREGENEIIFFTQEGQYLLSHVLLESQLKEVDFPSYFFEIAQEEFDNVEDESLRLRLTVHFVDVVTSKRGDLVFNGHSIPFDTKEVTETVDLSEDIVKGTNAIKIKPQNTLEIRELRVDLVD
jgi:hypothetical protein